MCKIRGIGVDLCAVSRMADKLDHTHFMQRCFTPSEIDYIHGKGAAAAESTAGIWAAKEAALKALGTGIALPMTDVEITHDIHGAPICQLHGKAAAMADGAHMLLSISHEGDTAIAFCVLQET